MFGCVLFLSQPISAQEEGATTGSLNGHEWVDLGLPSGLKWATCNVGAKTPEQYGNYYAWGETKPKDEYTQANSETYGLTNSELQSHGYIDEDGHLTPLHDAATANWGEGWRMPTRIELEELDSRCTWEWTYQNGVKGYKVTGPNGNSIFLPAAGYWSGTSYYSATCVDTYSYYWSSTPYSSNTNSAYFLQLRSSGLYVNIVSSRNYGCTVRPVTE